MKLLAPAAFKTKAEKMFRKANPEAVDLTIEWRFVSKPCKDINGKPFRNGFAVVRATGFRAKTMQATQMVDGFTVR